MIPKSKPTISTYKRTGLAAVALIILGAVGVWAFNTFRTYPLGSDGRVVYLGEQHSGDGIVSPSYDEYYYGTDMTPEELAGYLGGEITNASGSSSDSSVYSFRMKNGKDATIFFYKDKKSTYSGPPNWAKETQKRYFFFIIDDSYSTIRSSLEK